MSDRIVVYVIATLPFHCARNELRSHPLRKPRHAEPKKIFRIRGKFFGNSFFSFWRRLAVKQLRNFDFLNFSCLGATNTGGKEVEDPRGVRRLGGRGGAA